MADGNVQAARQKHIRFNGWSLLPSVVGVEAYAQLGWDTVTIDMQHGWWTLESATSAFIALRACGVTPYVRVPWNEQGILGRVLDAGARGVICPMINTADDARRLAVACLYPPAGSRSSGHVRGVLADARPGRQAEVNQEIAILPQIETAEAVENLNAILDVPGISGVYVGPTDLALSLGHKPVMDHEEPAMLSVYNRIQSACASRGLVAAIHNNKGAYAARIAMLGFDLVTVGSDFGAMIGAAAAELAVAHHSLNEGTRNNTSTEY